MPKAKEVSKERQTREARAASWKLFRRNHLLTQRRLAEELGLSRRGIQKIESGLVTPRPTTLRKFAAFAEKYDAHSELNLKEYNRRSPKIRRRRQRWTQQ